MRNLERCLSLLWTGIIACASVSALDALAQGYPAKPIRMVVGFAAGGGVDVAARIVAQKLAEHLGQSVIVENRTGASGVIANERVATSPPDGYTLLLLPSSGTMLPALHAKLPYNLERDFANSSGEREPMGSGLYLIGS